MKPHDEPHGLCSIAPIGHFFSALFGGGEAPAAATPAAPPPQAPPQSQPQGSPKQIKPEQSTFIGAAATPPTQSGQKTLLGQ